ncbi:hypothetical protein T484DRAFT_1837683 [Baffinella frigidus]|nr:hypothetical protein T484DRAFT_1837683 [Cryptophyta sp. CCMP2293]
MAEPIPLSFVRCEGQCEDCPVARRSQQQQQPGHRVEVLCDDGVWRAGTVISWGGEADNGDEGVLRVAFDPVRPDDANSSGPSTGSKKRDSPEESETGSASAPKRASVGASGEPHQRAAAGTPQTQHDSLPQNKPENGGGAQPPSRVAGGSAPGHTRPDSRNASRGSAVGRRRPGGRQGQGAKSRGGGSGLDILAKVAFETEAARKAPGGSAKQDTLEYLAASAAGVLLSRLCLPEPSEPLARVELPILNKVRMVGAEDASPQPTKSGSVHPPIPVINGAGAEAPPRMPKAVGEAAPQG